jgi:hypothetical protein
MDNKPKQQTLNSLNELTGLINGHMETIGREKDKLRKVKEMLDGILNNDEAYQEKEKLSKDAAREKQNVKSNILKQPQAYDLNFKIKEGRLELKQLEAELSKFLSEYQKASGSDSFEDANGETHQIVFTARLASKTHLSDENFK